MVLIVCLDNRDGLMFNNRRLSRDGAVIEDMLQTVCPEILTVSSYSAELFVTQESRICISDDPLSGECYFAEDGSFSEIVDRVSALIIYRWNRAYPSDLKFPIDLYKNRMKLQGTTEFAGTSHERITKEVYSI